MAAPPPTTYAWAAPELWAPALALLALGLARADLRAPLVAVAVALFAAAAWLFRAPRAPATAPPEDAVVAPAAGRVALLDCLLPFGHGRVVLAPRDPVRDASVIVAPLDGKLTALPSDADGALRFVLDAAPGQLTLAIAPRAVPRDNAVGRALSAVVPLVPGDAVALPIARGAPIALAKYGAKSVTLEFPLTNVTVQKELGAALAAGAPLGRIQAVWTGPDR